MSLPPVTEALLAERARWLDETARVPFERFREVLVAARSRGIDFAAAWREGTATVAHHLGEPQRSEWLSAVRDTRDGWQRAYQGEPQTRAEAALLVLVAAVTGRPDLPEPSDAQPRCTHCEGPIPAERGRDRTGRRRATLTAYCSDRCRRDAAYKRERERALANGRKVSAIGPISHLPTRVDALGHTDPTREEIAA